MMEALLSLLPGGWLTAAGGVLAVFAAAIWRAVTLGRSIERAKTTKRELEAKEEQLEMHREASDVERQARDLTHEEARREAQRWARPR